jgi:hypothetical protein
MSTIENVNDALEESLMLAQSQAVEKSNQLKRQLDQTTAASAHWRTKSQKILGKSQQMDQEASKLRQELAAADQLRDTLYFETLLLRLRRNDPTTGMVDGGTPGKVKFPLAYGKALGEALVDNTIVSTLNLTLDNLVANHHTDGLEAMRESLHPLLTFVS